MGFLWISDKKKTFPWVFMGFVSILLLFLVLLVLIVSWFGPVCVRLMLPHVFDETGWEFLHLCGRWFLLSSVTVLHVVFTLLLQKNSREFFVSNTYSHRTVVSDAMPMS